MLDTDTELLQELITESNEHLANIEPDLLALEKEGDQVSTDLVNRIFRAMHSIKGGFSFMGLQKITELSHTMESVLMRVRDGDLQVTDAITDSLLQGTDLLQKMLDDVENSEETDISNEVSRLNQFLAEGAEASPSQAAAEAETETAAPVEDSPATETEEPPAAATQPQEQEPLSDDAGQAEPPAEPSAAEEAPAEEEQPQETASSQETKTTAASETGTEATSPAAAAQPESTAPAAPAADKGEKAAASKGKDKESASQSKPAASASAESHESIRVRVDVLNRLMNEAGELVLGRNQIKQALNSRVFQACENSNAVKDFYAQLDHAQQHLEHLSGNDSKLNSALEHEFNKIKETFRQALNFPLIDMPGLSGVMQNVDLVTSELQGDIMNTRMQPVRTIFSKFNRIIRDLCRKMDKEIELVTFGEDVELDKSILEGLGDPLTHIIRNSADHGVETTQERQAAGKPPKGTITLKAYHESGQVVIEINDDGGGIDTDKVKEKAVRKEVITQEEADNLSQKEAGELIFAPGFSTADQISDVSGRGVGMDVVRTNIEQLGGTVDIDSQLGLGTTIYLKLPLTLAIIPSLIVKVEDRRFAVPQVSLEELVRIRADEAAERIQVVQGKPILRLRDKLLPLVRLADILGIPRTFIDENGNRQPDLRERLADRRQPDPSSKEAAEQTEEDKRRQNNDRRRSPESSIKIVVLKAGSNHYGLVVDELLDSEEIVVKPLSGYLRNCKCYAGATIMGDGKVAMILDAKGMADTADLSFSSINKEVAQLTRDQEDSMAEVQPQLMFQNGTDELFAINLSMVSRVEKVAKRQIERIGNKEYLRFEDSSLRILRLHDYLPIEAPTEMPEEFFVIVPKLVSYPMGIVALSIDDIVQTDAKVNRESLQGTGVLGTSMINNRMAIIVNIYSLFAAAEPELYAEENLAAEAASLKGARALLAEDTAFFRAVEEDYLRNFGCRVDVAKDGVEAWEMLQDGEYDILVTDIQMPRMDGLELTRKARSLPRFSNLPIVALTSLGTDSDYERGYAAGVDDYEIKLDKEKLEQTLTQALQKHHRSAAT